MNKTCEITICSDNKKKVYQIRKGLRLDAFAAKQKTNIEFSCRKANCGICLISILNGAQNISPISPIEKKFLDAMKSSPNERLACQCRIYGNISINDNIFEE